MAMITSFRSFAKKKKKKTRTIFKKFASYELIVELFVRVMEKTEKHGVC